MQTHIDGCRIHYELVGEGEPVLFIHGFPLRGEMWSDTARRLAPRWRSIVPDLRGHGQSEATPQMSMARFADDLAELLDHVAERRPAVIAGLSMGGMITFEFFRRHRNRVRALILADTRAAAETPEGAARRDAIAEAALRDGSKTAADSMIDQVFAPNLSPTIRSHWYAAMAATSPIGVAAAARAMKGRADSFPTLPKIDCPTLVVVGEDDTLTPPSLMQDIAERITDSRFVVIPESGHVPPVEQPERFANVVAGFLEQLPPLTASR